jgi:hypothetical protein
MLKMKLLWWNFATTLVFQRVGSLDPLIGDFQGVGSVVSLLNILDYYKEGEG